MHCFHSHRRWAAQHHDRRLCQRQVRLLLCLQGLHARMRGACVQVGCQAASRVSCTAGLREGSSLLPLATSSYDFLLPGG